MWAESISCPSYGLFEHPALHPATLPFLPPPASTLSCAPRLHASSQPPRFLPPPTSVPFFPHFYPFLPPTLPPGLQRWWRT